ncbi:unnamed protein product [Protopolystoma xenopodis]|uniref:Methyltransferase small domain-containing protein n=1 Tax=Protopolystoma xenopodis TaxID=117903 RepID=A0A448X0J1_9PLAT|nr:unnamed protein product [Protopolystoma xenopodis]
MVAVPTNAAECSLCDLVESSAPTTRSRRNLILPALISGGLFIGLGSYLTGAFMAPAFRRICLPYLPATPRQINNLLIMLSREKEPLGRLVDLGSGDGRVVSCR